MTRSAFRAITQAASAIQANPLRSVLGGLAIAVAVATMLIVGVALEGIRLYAEQTTARTFGADTFLIAQVASPGRISRRELLDQLARNPPITRGETRFLSRRAEGRVLYAPNSQARADVIRGSLRIEAVAVTGTTASLAQIRDVNIVDGRFFNADEDTSGSQVAVVGADVVDALFPDVSPIGQAIRIAGRRFDVIGLQGRVGSGGGSLDKYVWVPLKAHERMFGQAKSLQIFARAQGDADSVAAEDHARISLRAVRNLQPGTGDSFDVLAPETARGFVANLSTRIGAAAGPISLMALLAAVVVVTNTVLVSVTQRTREIGLRRALGARRGDVIREVLAESILLSLAGGACGAAAVALLVAAVGRVAPVGLTINASSLALTLLAAAGSGLAAGWLPAVRATRLDVITAIRAE